MEKNYRDLSAHQRTLAKRLHDFTNHMKTLEALSKESPAAQAYIAELLSTTYRNVKRCRSGNDVIDAIINCKAEEAEAQGIPFTYSVRLTEPLRISSVDLCAVLANQLDNALEASLKLPQESGRFVKVIVEQRNNFLSFRVENRVAQNPFDAHGHLVSTKKGESLPARAGPEKHSGHGGKAHGHTAKSLPKQRFCLVRRDAEHRLGQFRTVFFICVLFSTKCAIIRQTFRKDG